MNYQSFAIPSTYMYKAFLFGILIWERSHGEPHSWNILGLQWSEPHAKSYLKVPKREIFVTELFTLSDPICIGDLRIEPKNPFV